MEIIYVRLSKSKEYDEKNFDSLLLGGWEKSLIKRTENILFTISFLSSPIACVACEGTELLKTEIGVDKMGSFINSVELEVCIPIHYGMYSVYLWYV